MRQFDQTPQVHVRRSRFRMDFNHATTVYSDMIFPLAVIEVLPGDTFHISLEAFARQATPIFPIMDTQYLDVYGFFVPNRIVWDNWERFNGSQDNPGDSTDYRIPTVSLRTGNQQHTLQDYFGLPVEVVGTNSSVNVSALPWRAYNLIYNEWFRNQNFQNSLIVLKGDNDNIQNYQLMASHKQGDYFTRQLPWPQKGPGVTLPLGGLAPVGVTNATFSITAAPTGSSYGLDFQGSGGNINAHTSPITLDPTTSVYADLSAATAATVNSIRMAFQLQKMLERDARGGTRYFEILQSHFGVISPDSRLQRPEFLGHTRSYITQHVTPQTSETSSTSPQGNLSGYATASGGGRIAHRSFVEHGYILILGTIRSRLTYSQGIQRHWSRSTRFDYFWPALQHIGEQATLSQELYADGSAGDSDVFGYMPRYEEYKYIPNYVTGQMRPFTNNATPKPGAPLSLAEWNLSQYFSVRPLLNMNFLQSNTPMARVSALTTEPHFKLDAFFNVTAIRPMDVWGVPGMIDHF